MTRPWSLRLVAGLLAGLLGAAVLAGCSREQEASGSLPTSTAAPTTEQELPPLGPEDLPMPAEARTPDAAGAEAFVRYYIELINRTSEVMDAAPLREFSDGCAECDRIATNTEEDKAAGFDYVDGELTITEMTAPLLNGGRAEMALRVDQAPLVVEDRDGLPLGDLSSDAYVGLVSSAAVTWDTERSSWIMTGLTLG